jgi:hypothetical protein
MSTVFSINPNLVTSQAINRREEALRHAAAIVRSSVSSLRKSKRPCPAMGGWWRESKKSNKLPSHPECTKTAPKMAGFPFSAKNAVSYFKVPNKIYSRDIF